MIQQEEEEREITAKLTIWWRRTFKLISTAVLEDV
jgi:hypothetical protein